ncbi:MAG: ABC transporter substrate-binding protein [Oscillospiraceae bacterium]|nr:ABC transporter substrate-binding protein [Oscillospiraceae bacterium]
MRLILRILLTLATLLVSVSCGASMSPEGFAEQQPSKTASVVFTDDLGREIAIEPPKRVAVTMGSFADIWCLAGGKEQLVAAAADAFTEFDLDLSEDVANLGAIKEPSMETMLAASPDLVIASTNLTPNLEMLDTLEALSIPVAYFDASGFESYLNMLEICTRLTGCPENYRLYGEAVEARMEEARSRASGEAPTVLFLRVAGTKCSVKNSEGTVLGEMLADLGCRNLADSDASLLEDLSLEAIVAADPDFIFAIVAGSDAEAGRRALEETLLSNPAWSGLTAVREGRYYLLDSRLYHLKPNARWGEAYEQLAGILYPAKSGA